jgi:hypothetical protein
MQAQFFRYSIYNPKTGDEVASFDTLTEAQNYVDRFLNSSYEVEDINSGATYIREPHGWYSI